MKKSRIISAVLLVAAMIVPGARAQQMPQMPQLPVDKEVRIGTLPNGLTYYIRHNEYPKGQADFYIAQKVGSILEEDNQRGLAHFSSTCASTALHISPARTSSTGLKAWV